MSVEQTLIAAAVYLIAALVTVVIAKRLGLASIIGYLGAGVLIGPAVLKFVGSEGEDVMHFAEFGVVMMLFLIGLEVQPKKLWSMRRSIFGLGGLQVLITTLLMAGAARLFGAPWNESFVIGMMLALSSTAIVMQMLDEKGLLKSLGGQSSFSVLLFQDLAVIPILILVPLLGSGVAHAAGDGHGGGMDTGPIGLLKMLGMVVGIIAAGRLLVRPLFRLVASTGLREAFTAAALLVVILAAVGMHAVGLSAALGTFLAGMLLADSEYRHEIEVDIQPFKGLLLGLFFVTVGASINFGTIAGNWESISLIVACLVAIKAGVLIVLARFFGIRGRDRLIFSFALAQGGEFAFVISTFALQSGALDPDRASVIISAVALSMLVTPLLMIPVERAADKLNLRKSEPEMDEMEGKAGNVIIVGFGRFGWTVGRLLRANGFDTTVLDLDQTSVTLLKEHDIPVYYGDGARVDLLRSAGADDARAIVVAVNEMEDSMVIVRGIRKNFPDTPIVARAVSMRHHHALLQEGVEIIEQEVFGAALDLGESLLKMLGYRAYQAARASKKFKKHEIEHRRELLEVWDKEEAKSLFARERARADQMEAMLSADEEMPPDSHEAWSTGEPEEESSGAATG